MKVKRLRPECLSCLGKRYLEKYPEGILENEKEEYRKRTMEILEGATEDEGAPVVVNRISKLRHEMFGIEDDFKV